MLAMLRTRLDCVATETTEDVAEKLEELSVKDKDSEEKKGEGDTKETETKEVKKDEEEKEEKKN